MNILYAFVITLLVYPIFGTLVLILVENLRVSLNLKILILTFGHPILAAIFIWLLCSMFNPEIAKTGVLIVGGSLLRIPFSDRKYFSSLARESGVLTITYVSELLKRKVIKIDISEIKGLTQSKSDRLIDKPSELLVTLPNQTLSFKILEKNFDASV